MSAGKNKSILCVSERDGGGCGSDGSQWLYLVVHPDKSTEVICKSCIEANAGTDYFGIGTLVFQIGDDVTHHFF